MVEDLIRVSASIGQGPYVGAAGYNEGSCEARQEPSLRVLRATSPGQVLKAPRLFPMLCPPVGNNEVEERNAYGTVPLPAERKQVIQWH